ncbi:MAG: hypothetical protein ACHQ6T_04145 [Myxococcota bacterium]
MILAGCAVLSPPLDEVWRDPSLPTSSGAPLPLALVALGAIGEPHARDERLHAAIARRIAAEPAAPIVVLGDVFQRAGLLGFCAGESHRVSLADCAQPDSTDAQFDAILGPYARSFAGHPMIALAGSADHAGDPQATHNACARIPAAAAGWRYVARGCELDDERPVARLDAGALALVLLDSEAMLEDGEFRDRALAMLHAELASIRQERPGAWLVLALHHPLESYGAHNGATLTGALHKDLYPIAGTLLYPIVRPLEWALGRPAENPYEWRVRALRRALYGALARTPVDAVLSGQDESLQLVELTHPGARWQIVSGAGAEKTRVKRLGLDLLWANRAARALGAGALLPAVQHRLLFAAGRGDDDTRSGYGFVALAASPERLRVEFWDMAAREPLGVAELRRAGDPAQSGQREDE